MKFVIFHPSLNSAGGAEFVCLHLFRTMRGRGWKVALVTVDRTNWQLLKKIFGEIYYPSEEHYLFSSLPTKIPALNTFLLLSFYFAELISWKFLDKDAFLINMCGEKVDSLTDLAYVNGTPLRCAYFLKDVRAKRKCVGKLYDRAMRIFDRISHTLVVANSRYNEDLLTKCTNKRTIVIYPPVNLESYLTAGLNSSRENIVVIVSRFLPEQNLEYIPELAKLVTNADFILIGSSGPTSKGTLRKLDNIIGDLKERERIKILTNQPLSKYLELLSRAKVFIRTLPHEPFGMSVVEAMAAGCVPVVPRNGGPWYDILDQSQGKYGYSYETIEEAASLISILLENEKLRTEISNRARLRAMDFGSVIFERKILKILEKTYLSKFRTVNPKTTEPT